MNIDSLSAAEIDDLIFNLARRRNELEPSVPMKIDDLKLISGALLHQQNNPSMAIAPHADTGGTRLLLRSGGLGWIEFIISKSNSIAMRDWLTNVYGNEGASIFSKSTRGQNLPI